MSLFTELKRRNVIRVAIAYIAGAWVLTEVSGTLFPAFGIPDWGVRFVVIMLALGFLPALIISWAYELTPEGLKREKDVVRDASITHLTAKRLDGITIGLIVVALAFIMTDRLWLSPRLVVQPAPTTEVVPDDVQGSESEPQYPPNSIAVLPFVNMSSDPEQEYFSDGISEELLNLLSKIPEMRVISRSSAFSFKGKEVDIPTIATQLNVAYILEGSVRKAGNQVRITAQLIEARSDAHLWSETYDRELENIFVVQDEISAAIMGAVREPLGLNVEVVPHVAVVTNTEAHDAYLRGKYLVVQRTTATIEAAVSEFEKAITIDPGYALAHAELSMAILMLRNNVYGRLSHDEAIARAGPHAKRAIELDSRLAESHASYGFLQWSQENYEEALKHFERAIQVNPSYSIVYTWMANLLEKQFGRYGDAFVARESALRVDPLSGPAITNYVMGLIVRNRLDDAEREIEKITFIYPGTHAYLRGELTGVDGGWANLMLGSLNTLLFNPESIAEKMELSFRFAMIGLKKEALAIPVILYPEVMSILGKPADAVAISEKRCAEIPGSNWIKSRLGKDLAAMGDYARARPILEQMWQLSGGQISERGTFVTDNAAALIVARRDAGLEAGTDELVAAIRDSVRRKREAGMIRPMLFDSVDFEEGVADFLAGERGKGLELIARAAEDGFYIMPSEAYLQTLYDDPGFAPIMAGQEAQQARERDRFLLIVCNNNPYVDVWQPAEETCDRFAAEQRN